MGHLQVEKNKTIKNQFFVSFFFLSYTFQQPIYGFIREQESWVLAFYYKCLRVKKIDSAFSCLCPIEEGPSRLLFSKLEKKFYAIFANTNIIISMFKYHHSFS